MKNMLLALTAFVMFYCCEDVADKGRQSAVNLESVDAFFDLADRMTAGEAITEKDWDRLLSTPGYSVLTDHFGRELIIDCISLGISPERREERDRRLAIPLTQEEFMDRNVVMPWFMAQNFAETLERWQVLKEFRRTFDFDGLQADATALLESYLINPIDSLIEFPHITYVCMDKNARSLDKGIVMDLNLASENTYDMTVREMAHEMFHTYRSKVMDTDFIYSNDLIWALAVLQNEGVADLIDKEPYKCRKT